MRPQDTSAEAHEVQLGIYRAMSPERRVEIALELSDGIRKVAIDGIRHRHPEYSDGEVRRAVVALIYGDDLARRVWPQGEIPLP
jgi:hypothetical protein